MTLVFLQHYAAGASPVFGWGWTGVDVFFVLSGFLITGILYDSQHQPHRFRDFYMRRTLRIFPLYYAIWLAALLLMPLAHWQWNWRWSLWPAYAGNYARFLFLHDPGDPYRFDRLTGFGGSWHLYIGHFWSLCVEEQFYLLWPLVVYTVRRRRALMTICACVLLLAPLLRAVLSNTVPAPLLHMELLYRSMPTRADALLLGGWLALALRGPAQHVLRNRRHLCLAVSLLALAIGAMLATVFHLPFQGSAFGWVTVWGFSLIDLVAVSLVLVTIHPGGWPERALSWAPLRNLGTVSYGFYVYHDLLHDLWGWLGRRILPTHAPLLTALLAFPASWLIAACSFRWFESPILRLKRYFTHQEHRAPTA